MTILQIFEYLDYLVAFSNIFFSFIASFILKLQGGSIKSSIPVKADWQPPDYVFGIVWPILYLIFGFINIRVMKNNKIQLNDKDKIIFDSLKESLYQNFWVVITGINHPSSVLIRYTIGLVILIYLNYFAEKERTVDLFNHDKVSHYLYIPYSFWIKFALILNFQIVRKLVLGEK